jgi:MFS superfamily sulfate permease-like transporter
VTVVEPTSASSAISLEPTVRNFFRHDGPAGTVVFLVALPLCLGIALASGAPLFAGVIAGIVGGIVVSFLSGSQLSVSGPAAGLAVIVAAAIHDLGSYRVFLMAVVLSGLIQLVLGLLRSGVLADYVPNAVIKGMLAAIGIVIILKQIPHALGRDQDYVGDFAFLGAKGGNTITDIISAVLTASPGAVLISAASLVLLLAWERLASRGLRFFNLVPGALIVVLLGIALNNALGTWAPTWKLTEAEHLVNLPVARSPQDFFGQFMLPDFTAIGNQKVWVLALTIAIVGSLETLLSLEAADRLDPYRRISPPNRELRAQGVGNFISGLIGGLPITSVVVRTSANVYAGARTWMASFTHGCLLFAATLLVPAILNWTPLASLAAILCTVGYKLTKVQLYRTMFRGGLDQFLPFIVTVVAIIVTDLLRGVLIGLAVGLFFVIRANHHDAITVVSQDNLYLLRFNKDASFVNKSELRRQLRQLKPGSQVILDATRSLYIDHDIQEVVDDFRLLAPYKNITVELKNFRRPIRRG